MTGYMEDPYLDTPYLSGTVGEDLGMQATLVITQETPLGMQATQSIIDETDLGMQALQVITKTLAVGMQALQLIALRLGSQATQVLYNVTNIRILCNFDSRGSDNTDNWTSTSTASGSFEPVNMNTDIVEQVFRTTGTTVTLTCDTEVVQGVTPDTFAILNHNLTSGASVVVQGSNTAGFASVNETFNMTREETNMFFLVPFPDFPFSQQRFWRFLISDPTNSDGFIQIGAILFGSSTIFQGDCITDRISKKTTHFADKVETEGFTNVSNDRALKFGVGIQFRNLNFGLGNYSNLRDIFDTARTTLKCLWIPDPRNPSRFAIFGKLRGIPTEQHNVKGDANEDLDFVTFDVDVDEAL